VGGFQIALTPGSYNRSVRVASEREKSCQASLEMSPSLQCSIPVESDKPLWGWLESTEYQKQKGAHPGASYQSAVDFTAWFNSNTLERFCRALEVCSQDKLRSRLINAARLGRSFSLTALNFNPSPPPGFTWRTTASARIWPS
jgi:hypothetical protein